MTEHVQLQITRQIEKRGTGQQWSVNTAGDKLQALLNNYSQCQYFSFKNGLVEHGSAKGWL